MYKNCDSWEDECPDDVYCDKCEDSICEKGDDCVKEEPRTSIRAIDKLKGDCKQVPEDWGLKLPNYQLIQLDVTNLNGRIYPENEVQAMIGRWYSKGALPVPVRQSTCTDVLGEGDKDVTDLDKLKEIGKAYNFKVRDGWLTCTIELNIPQKFPYFTLSCTGESDYIGEIDSFTTLVKVKDLELTCICNSYTNSNTAGCTKQYRQVCKELYDARKKVEKLERHNKNLENDIKGLKRHIVIAERTGKELSRKLRCCERHRK